MNALTEALALAFLAACFFGVAVIMAVRSIGRDLRRERDDLRRERDSLVKERDSLRRERSTASRKTSYGSIPRSG